MRHFIVVLNLIFLINFSYSQEIVVLTTESQPISSCLVYNSQKSLSSFSDINGIVDITNFSESDTLIFKHISFLTKKVLKSEIITKKLNKIWLTEISINLNDFVFISNKSQIPYNNTSHKIDIIPAAQINFSNQSNTAELLSQTGNVFTQQSQLGGGSPVIRGMEANRVLLVVDGIRMNNAIFRAGHLQNVITIDPFFLDRVEILHGPGSVMYGSDAMGGVMHFYSKSPQLSVDDKVFTNGSLLLRYGSAANEYYQNFKINVGGKKLALLFGGSTKKVGDLRMGSVRDEKYGDWGKRLFYVERFGDKDSAVVNSNPLIQKGSAYSQYDLLAKVFYKPSEKYNVLLNMQYSNSSNVPRYDRLTEVVKGLPRYAEWYYGPQERIFISLRNNINLKNILFDKANIDVAYQQFQEDRINRRFNKNSKRHQEEDVKIWSFGWDMYKNITEKNELQYGFGFDMNDVHSQAYNENIKTGEIKFDAVSRYPDNGNTMDLYYLYLTHNWVISPKIRANQGLRFNYIALKSEYTDEMLAITNFPIEKSFSQKNNALNGNLGLTYTPTDTWRLALNVANGFRAPNVDDVGKINDSNSDEKLLIIPNANLKPEHVVNVDMIIEKVFGQFCKVGVTGFYSKLFDAFVLQKDKLNGQDSILYNGTMSHIESLQNAKKATIYGVETFAIVSFTNSITLKSNLTYIVGKIDEQNKPLDHIPPLYGMTSLQFSFKKVIADVYCRYNGMKKIEDYSDSGEDNPVYATVDGMPAWYTLNARLQFFVNKNINLNLGVENILDKHYRYFASGISAPGRNIVVSFVGKI